MRWLLYLFLFFLYIFGPVFNNINSWLDFILITSFGLFSVFFIFEKNQFPSFYKVFLIFIPFFGFYAILSLLNVNIRIGDFIQILFRPVRILITLLGGFALVGYIYRKGEGFVNEIIALTFFSVVAHAIIMVVQMHNPDFKDLIYEYTTVGEFRSSFDYNFRMGGLSGASGGAILSVVQSLGVIIGSYLIKQGNSKLYKVLILLLQIIIVYSVLICGRSGIWNLIVFLPIYLILSQTRVHFSSILKYVFILCSMGYLVFEGVSYYIKTAPEADPLAYAFERTMDTFLKAGEEGSFEDETANILVKHILWPDDLQIWLVGNTEHLINSQFSRTLNSDIGYIRNLWSYGLIGAILFVFPALFFVRKAFENIKTTKSARLFVIISLSMIFFQAKENFLYTRMLFSLYSVFLALLYYEMFYSNKIKTRKK